MGKTQKRNSKNVPNFFTIAYNMKACLRFYTLIFLISQNLAKHTYGLSPLEHHKIEKTTLNSSGFYLQFLLMDFIQKKNLK
jgi:hypothetical protein